MRFTIRKVGCGNERIGTMTGFGKSPKTIIPTPTFGLFTQGGSVVHLTSEVLAKVFLNPQLLWVPLVNSIHLEHGVQAQGEGVAKFAGLEEHITCVSFNNSNEETPPGHLEGDKIPLWTRHGKKTICADRYMDVMEIFKPDIFLAIADSATNLNDGHKRLSKSVIRTCTLLDTCLNRYKASTQLNNSSLIGVIVAPGDEKKCQECIQHMLTHHDHLGGVALSGITNGSEEANIVPVEQLEAVFKRVADAIPKDLVRFVEGSWNPVVIMSAIEQGWDIFDGSYAVKLTNAGLALTLNLNLSRCVDQLCIIDLSDERYKDQFSPILEGCECLACKKHTRAYVRHLLNTREMLSSVLLSIHNLHHFDQMFQEARRHIAAGTFQAYKKHITDQYQIYNTSQLKVESIKCEREKQDNSNKTKKPKVSNGTNVTPVVNGS